jgi:hypothetical protein
MMDLSEWRISSQGLYQGKKHMIEENKGKTKTGKPVSLLGLKPHFFQITETHVTAEKTAQWLS